MFQVALQFRLVLDGLEMNRLKNIMFSMKLVGVVRNPGFYNSKSLESGIPDSGKKYLKMSKKLVILIRFYLLKGS